MGKKKTRTHKVGRDAATGKFIPVKEAQRRKKTAIVETIRTPGPSVISGSTYNIGITTADVTRSRKWRAIAAKSGTSKSIREKLGITKKDDLVAKKALKKIKSKKATIKR